MRGTVPKLLIDLILWSLPVPLAFWIRLENVHDWRLNIFIWIIVGLPFKAFALAFFGFPRRGWRNVSTTDVFLMTQAVGVVCICLFAVNIVMQPILAIPRSLPLIESLIAVLLLCGVRLFARIHHENSLASTSDKIQRVVIVGAGETGTMIAREMQRHPESGMHPVAFLDDDKSKQRQVLCDTPVLGTISSMPAITKEMEADEIVIAMPSVGGGVIRRVAEIARKTGVPFRTMPGIYDLLSGRVKVSQLREVNVEDLLRREPVNLEMDTMGGYLRDSTILVTGGGGSIGSEIVNQAAQFGPKRILLLGKGENSLFATEQRIKSDWPELDYKIIIASVRDRNKVIRVFKTEQPNVVFHAAAHKHVPLMECNPDEAILNNVEGTLNLVSAALENEIKYFVNISTDKAVNPTSIMGASKRVAEMVVKRGASSAKEGQVYVSVRFGNVLGSRGSVVPLFREQIKKGRAITVTHPDMLRYFMTIPEAASLVLEAGGMNLNGSVIVLDMGEPVKIMDLAKDMIRLSGYEPNVDIKIQLTGLRPGEKLFEEYLTAEEGCDSTHLDKIYVARNSALSEDFDMILRDLISAALDYNTDRINQQLRKAVPSFRIN